MREIDFTGQYKRDYKRMMKSQHAKAIDEELDAVLTELLEDRRLDAKYRDHQLTGNFKDCRDCHVRPDLVLIYRKIDPPPGKPPKVPGPKVLQLVRLGSHSELGL